MDELRITPQNVFEAQLRDTLNNKVTNQEALLAVASMVVFSNDRNESLSRIYSTLGLNVFIRVMDIFAGKSISFPTLQELEELLILVVCYYFREIESMEWDEIKNLLPFPINPVLYGHKIGGLNKQIRAKMNKALQVVDIMDPSQGFLEAIVELQNYKNYEKK